MSVFPVFFFNNPVTVSLFPTVVRATDGEAWVQQQESVQIIIATERMATII
ncbi:MAG: hypothetical protein LBB16_03870 [Puniceicoccales bacterium]|nr:hypothetical protein [Puniceicoccales bacterium]